MPRKLRRHSHVPTRSAKMPHNPDHRRRHRPRPLHGPPLRRTRRQYFSRRPPRRAPEANRHTTFAPKAPAPPTSPPTFAISPPSKPWSPQPKKNSARSILLSTTPPAISSPAAKNSRRTPSTPSSASSSQALSIARWCSAANGSPPKQPGNVLNIVTTYAATNSGSGFVMPSACAKAGVLAMTRSLAVEWAKLPHSRQRHRPRPVSHRRRLLAPDALQGNRRAREE